MANVRPTGEEKMKSSIRFLVPALAAMMMAQIGWAQTSKEPQNKVTAYLAPGASDKQAVIAIWMTNATPVIGITLPFKFSAGDDTLRLDSVWTAGGRAARFIATPPQFKTANQTFLVNMIWATDSTTRKPVPIPSGEGAIMWLSVHTDGKFPMDKLRMVAVQLPPENVLLFVTDAYATVNPSFELVRKAPPSSPAEGEKVKGKKKT